MQYRDLNGMLLSRLGMGNMRLPVSGGKIDTPRADEIISLAMKRGINYYDTASIYHNGESETFLGRSLSRFPRSSYCIATKFYIDAEKDYRATFEQQLKKLRTDRIDFYLLHSVTDANADSYLSCGCIDYFEEQRELGRITQLGFSSHASPQVLRTFTSAHEWRFAQIQLNYLDWTCGTAREEYEILVDAGLPIIVMEPLQGGALADLGPELNGRLASAEPRWSPASWAMRWLMRLPQIHVVLSGMSTLRQMQDNLATFDEPSPLSDEHAVFLENIAKIFKGRSAVPCTSCRYCTTSCPKGIDIPAIISAYNAYRETQVMPKDIKQPSCSVCGMCTTRCPQNIDIPKIMNEIMLYFASSKSS